MFRPPRPVHPSKNNTPAKINPSTLGPNARGLPGRQLFGSELQKKQEAQAREVDIEKEKEKKEKEKEIDKDKDKDKENDSTNIMMTIGSSGPKPKRKFQPPKGFRPPPPPGKPEPPRPGQLRVSAMSTAKGNALRKSEGMQKVSFIRASLSFCSVFWTTP